MNWKTLLIFFTILVLSCKDKQCDSLPTEFDSYEKALKSVKAVNYMIEDEVTLKSSWLRSAKYFSCDGAKGFFIIRTDDREYIHKDLPIGLWNEFKSASSFGSFYANRIKGKYRLEING